jgi:hypothetical protein
VAYGAQLGARRTTVHAAVAQAIAGQYPERLDEHSEPGRPMKRRMGFYP